MASFSLFFTPTHKDHVVMVSAPTPGPPSRQPRHPVLFQFPIPLSLLLFAPRRPPTDLLYLWLFSVV